MSQPTPAAGLSTAQLRLLWIVAALLAFGWLLSRLSGALAPFLAAALLAYAGNPLVEKLAAHGVRRAIGSALVIFVSGLFFAGLLLTVVPLVIELSGRVATRLPGLLTVLQNETLPWLKTRFGITLTLDLPHLTEFARQHAQELQALVTRLLGTLTDGGRAMMSLLMLAVLVPVVLYYLLVDWNVLVRRLDELIPRRWHGEAQRLLGEVNRVLGQFLRGQLLVMLVLAAYYTLALTVAGVEFALPLGLVTGLLIFIPYVGFSIGLILALLSAALQGGGLTPVVAVAVIYGGGQLIEGFVLTPWLVGDRIGLHPVAVIFALLAFGQLFGFIGLLLALPAAACVLVGLRALRQRYLASELYQST